MVSTKAKIIIGSQFGDEGKGLVTDWLCSEPNVKDIVVRFSGGQQAGHTVFHRGVKHVFSNFGSGSLKGVPTYFADTCTMYLNTLRQEHTVLSKLISYVELIMHPAVKVTTPYDVAYNRIREKQLGHGSCGLGVAATQKRNAETPYKLLVSDLRHFGIFMEKLNSIKEYYKGLVAKEGYSLSQFTYEVAGQMTDFLDAAISWKSYFLIRNYDALKDYDKLIFEGSQGILLDEVFGVFPNVTYGRTGSMNAIRLCQRMGVRSHNIEIYYVTRCYQTRHGAGWMSNENPIELINNEEEINVFNDWQKNFRTGEIDYDLLNYVIEIDSDGLASNKVVRNLVVTCLDQRPEFSFDWTKISPLITGRYESHGVSDKIKKI